MGALSFDALLRSLKQGVPDPVYYLHGDEDVLKDEAIRALLERAVEPAARDFNVDQRSAADLDAASFHALVNTPPMLAARRVVVIRGLDPLPPARVERWMAHRARQLGLTLAPGAGDLLLGAVGNDLAALAQEIEKLAALAAGRGGGAGGGGSRPITREDVTALVGVRSGETVQDLVDAALERRGAAAAQLVGPVLEQAGMSGVRVVTALGTALLGTALARAELDRGAPRGRLESLLLAHLRAARPHGLGSWEHTAASWARWASVWSLRELSRALRLALDADGALKSSTVTDERGILEQLVLAWGVRAREAA